MKKYDVFISYSRKNSEVAEKICQALDDAKLTYFIDKTGIYSGEEFMQVLAVNILDSEVFLFLGSEPCYTSKYTSMEVAFAIKHNAKIIPYQVDDSPLPPKLELAFSPLNKRRLSNFPIDKLIEDIKTKINADESVEATYAENYGTAYNNLTEKVVSIYKSRSIITNSFMVAYAGVLFLIAIAIIWPTQYAVIFDKLRLTFFLIIANLWFVWELFLGKKRSIYITSCLNLLIIGDLFRSCLSLVKLSGMDTTAKIANWRNISDLESIWYYIGIFVNSNSNINLILICVLASAIFFFTLRKVLLQSSDWQLILHGK